MKLLLTSAGISNKSIEKALLDFMEKPFSELNLAFIPTASNVEKGNKDWLIKDLQICTELGFKQIDIVDISALPKEHWEPRLNEADVLMFEGGDTYYLMHWVDKSGLKDLLPEMLKTKVYIGISAGSMICCPKIHAGEKLYSSEKERYKRDEKALGLVDFYIEPHLNSPWFPEVKDEFLKEIAEKVKEPMYAIDDNTAIKVTDEKVEVITEGKYIRYN